MPPIYCNRYVSLWSVVNYYRNMWSRTVYTFAFLNKTTPSKIKFRWTKFEKDVFESFKRIVVVCVLLASMKFNEEFEIVINAGKFQLEAVIIQNDKPIIFCSIKLTGAHMRYTITAQEIFSIIVKFEEFRNIILGKIIIIYTYNISLRVKF